MFGKTGLEADRTHLVGRAAGWAHGKLRLWVKRPAIPKGLDPKGPEDQAAKACCQRSIDLGARGSYIPPDIKPQRNQRTLWPIPARFPC